MSIVITGATGHLGRMVIADLLTAGISAGDIRAIVRDTERAADLEARGIAVHPGDYDTPATLAGAFEAGDRVLLISGSEVGRRVPQHQTVVEAAATAGVAQLAYTSVFGGPAADFALAAEHQATEQLIRDCGLPYTFLRNNWYSEVYAGDLGDLPTVIERGEVVNSVAPGSRIATASRSDYAAAAAAVLTRDEHLNTALELSGDTAWTFEEFAGEVSRQTGRTVIHRSVTPAEQSAILVSLGLPEQVAAVYVGVDGAISRGRLAGTPGTLSTLIGRPTTPIARTIAATLTRT